MIFQAEKMKEKFFIPVGVELEFHFSYMEYLKPEINYKHKFSLLTRSIHLL